MFTAFMKRRRGIPSQSNRLLLEMLEDRIVPSIANGAILVATAPSSFAAGDQSSFPTGIMAIDPGSGAQSVVSAGGLFSLPTYIAEGPNQQLYVSDLTAFGTGAILRVDPNTGQQNVVAMGGFINGPNVLVFVDGFLYVADEGDASGTIHDLIKIDPNTGAQTLLTSNQGFAVPTGMAVAPNHNVYVSDEPGNVQGADPGKVWLVNLDNGHQTLISSNNPSQGVLFNHPVDVAVDASGNLLVANTGSAANNYAGSILRINPQTGVQALITSFGPSSGIDSVEVGLDGTIFVGAIANGASPGQIIAVDPASGAQTTAASGGNLSLVEGIAVFQANISAAATTTTVTSSATPSVFGQSVTLTATVSVPGPGSGRPTGTVQFQIDGNPVGVPVTISKSGIATFSTASLAAGSHSVTASYTGDASFAASSGTLLGGQPVNQASTSAVVVSSATPVVLGQAVTFTTTVGAQDPGVGTPTGTVQFYIDGNPAGGPVSIGGSGTAMFSTATLPVGVHTITASYSGDANFAASAGGLSGGEKVDAVAAPTVSASVTQSQLWPLNKKLVDVGLSVTVTPSNARLVVQVYANDNAGTADAADIAPGTLQLRAQRNGDGRIYLIVVMASNPSGTSFDVCAVVAPRNQSSGSVDAIQQQAAAAEANYRQFQTVPDGFVLLGESASGGGAAGVPLGKTAASAELVVNDPTQGNDASNASTAPGEVSSVTPLLLPAQSQTSTQVSPTAALLSSANEDRTQADVGGIRELFGSIPSFTWTSRD
jgi:sugar lactone lactonase YvrE